MNSIGFKIKKIRELRGYSQFYVASELNITQSAYSKIENGCCKLCTTRFIEISKILKVEPNKILNFNGTILLD